MSHFEPTQISFNYVNMQKTEYVISYVIHVSSFDGLR